MLHTLAHMLMRQMSFDAGYAASSIRERVYSTTTSVLAAGWSADLLRPVTPRGHLAASPEWESRMAVPVFARALGAAQWCSLDPVSPRVDRPGDRFLSLAACHACALAADQLHSLRSADRPEPAVDPEWLLP